MLLFVYGTLMRDLWNNHLLYESTYLGECKTVYKHMITIDGKIPYLSQKEELFQVKGELYDVSYETLKDIDKLEFEGEWYHRKDIEVENDNTIIVAQAYFNDGEGVRLESGDYKDFLYNYDKFYTL